MTRKIHSLMVIGLTAAAAGLSGCIIESSSSGSCASNQFVIFDWVIEKQSTGAPLSCGQAGTDLILLDLNGTPFEFSCPFNAFNGTARTTQLLEGSYPSSLQLITPANVVVSQVAFTAIVPRCGPADLDLVTFETP